MKNTTANMLNLAIVYRRRPLGSGHAVAEHIRYHLDILARFVHQETDSQLYAHLLEILAASLHYLLEHFDSTEPQVITAILNELDRATSKFGAFDSTLTGLGVLREECEELWDAIKSKSSTDTDRAEEAVQIAAMCLRFAVDCLEVERA